MNATPARGIGTPAGAIDSVRMALADGDAETLRAFARAGAVDQLPLELLIQAFLYTPFRADLVVNPRFGEPLRQSLAEWLGSELAEGRCAMLAAGLVELLDDAGRPFPARLIVQPLRVAISRHRAFGFDERRRLARAAFRYPDDLTPKHLESIYELVGRSRQDAAIIVGHPHANGSRTLLRQATKDWLEEPGILTLIARHSTARDDPALVSKLLSHRDPSVCATLASASGPDECRRLHARLDVSSEPHKVLAFLAAMPDAAWAGFGPADLLPLLQHPAAPVRVQAQTLVCRLPTAPGASTD
jgi:hypothetical protein